MNNAALLTLLRRLSNEIGNAIERVQADIVAENLQPLTPEPIVSIGSIEAAADALSPAHKALVHDAAIAVDEIGEDELERAINPPPATFPREPSVKLARCRCVGESHMDPDRCPSYNLRPVAGSQLAEANAIPEPTDYRHTDIPLPDDIKPGDLVAVGGWQYELTVEGALEALAPNDPRLIEVPAELVGPQPDPGSIFAARRRAEGEGIERDLARENEFFTRTQGWDPRGDGP